MSNPDALVMDATNNLIDDVYQMTRNRCHRYRKLLTRQILPAGEQAAGKQRECVAADTHHQPEANRQPACCAQSVPPATPPAGNYLENFYLFRG